MYEKTTIHGIIFILCIFAYLVSPKKDMNVSIQEVQARSETQTGETREVSVWTQAGKVERQLESSIQDTKQAHRIEENVKTECDATCKVNTLVSLWIDHKIAWSLVFTCKDKAVDPVKCIKLGASIVKAESGGWYNCYKNWCFWILSGGISYKSVEAGVEDWVKRYNLYWYRQENPSNFYSNSPNWNPKTHYCMSEHQTNWTKLSYCPNWHKHSWNMFKNLDKIF